MAVIGADGKGSHDPATVFRPGDLAPHTGIYRVIHHRHRPEHDVIVICGEELPACRTCKGAVRFTIQITGKHVTHDFDFARTQPVDANESFCVETVRVSEELLSRLRRGAILVVTEAVAPVLAAS